MQHQAFVSSHQPWRRRQIGPLAALAGRTWLGSKLSCFMAEAQFFSFLPALSWSEFTACL